MLDTESKSVNTDMSPPAVGVLPMVTPVNVIVTVLLFPMVPVSLEMIIDDCCGAAALHVPLEDATLGVGLVAKKLEG